ncbi:MAG: membrane protein insertion efficiency factor YidD [Clostridia bacterium]|nr:membrane protein insertion efficiency factor YidD [Clostridia bacterium]
MKILLIKVIKFYQKCISPYKGSACCRFTPTCSEYAIQAIEKYGVIKGMRKAICRILRCHPFCKGGYDPLD